MGKAGAFLNVDRLQAEPRGAKESVRDYDEFTNDLPTEEQCEQASRCMNCGVAFCQGGIALSGIGVASGCPLGNLIPETNDLLYLRRWDDAAGRLLLTNPFPEFTGRVCPAPCEIACNLGLNKQPVTIHDNERALANYIWELGISPLERPSSDSPLVTVIGSGPAGLACAWELTRLGIRVRVIERADRPGGLLMYGIPNMKLPKEIIMRRVQLMEESGIEFVCNTDACTNANTIIADSDAVVIASGFTVARTVDVPGSNLSGIHLAVDYLTNATRSLLDEQPTTISAKDKDVVVVGGGDTGVDCVATALRQGARSVTQLIRAKRPLDKCDSALVWPDVRKVYVQGYGQRESQELFGEDPRVWSVDTIAFIGDSDDHVSAVRIQDISYDGERHNVEGTKREIPAQLVLIAKGFCGAETGLFEAFEASKPSLGSSSHRLESISETPIYVAGDVRLGSTLVATAMADALACANEVALALQESC